MRLAHKRNVQNKLRKFVKAAPASARPTKEVAVEIKEVKTETVVENKVEIALTPKQQQVLDIVVKNAEGINRKASALKRVKKTQKRHLGQLVHLRS